MGVLTCHYHFNSSWIPFQEMCQGVTMDSWLLLQINKIDTNTVMVIFGHEIAKFCPFKANFRVLGL